MDPREGGGLGELVLAATEIDLTLVYPAENARPVDQHHVEVLARSIGEIGLLEPISVRPTKRLRAGIESTCYEVIAGMHRVKAFRRLERATIPAFIRSATDIVAEMMLIDENLCRKDLSPAERARAVHRRKQLYEMLHPETRNGAGTGGRERRAKVDFAKLAKSKDTAPADRFTKATAEMTGGSERAVQRDAQRGEILGEDVLRRIKGTSLDCGHELDALVKMDPEARERVVEGALAGQKVSAKLSLKKLQRDGREVALAQRQRSLPDKQYGVIYADPEWDLKAWSPLTGTDRSAANHYPTSGTEAIMARPVADIAAPDAVLFLWATVPMMPDALAVMEAWGFTYRSQVAWVRDRIGTGYWFRNRHELLLVGTRGDIPAPAPGTQWQSVVEAPVGRHSEKPERFAEMIEAYFPNLPKIELNARRARPGWDVWGLEAPDAAEAAA